jgi:hypothetical protein
MAYIQLEEILAKEEQFKRNCEKILSAEEADKKEVAELQKTLHDVIPQLYEVPEYFALIKSIFQSRVNIMNKRAFEHEDEMPNAVKDIGVLLKNCDNKEGKYKNPYFLVSLQAAEQMIRHNSLLRMPDNMEFVGITTLTHNGPIILKNVERFVKPEQMEDIIHYVKNCGALQPMYFSASFWVLPGCIRMAQMAGYEKEVDSMIKLLGKIRHNGYIAMDLTANIAMDEPNINILCRKLKRMGKLDYYTKIADIMLPVAHINPTNLQVLTDKELPKMLESYEKEGLLDSFFDNLRYAVEKHKNDLPLDINKMIAIGAKDFWFEFAEHYPELREKFGDNCREYFSKIYDVTGNTIWGCAYHSLEHFFESGLSKKVSIDDWLSFAKRGLDAVDFHHTKEGGFILDDSVEALVENVDLDVYLRFLPQLVFNHTARNKEALNMLKEDKPDDVKALYLDYFSVLDTIKNLPKPRCEESWLHEVADMLKMDYPRFVEWLNHVSSETRDIRAKVKAGSEDYLNAYGIFVVVDEVTSMMAKTNVYINTLPQLIEHGVDLMKAFDNRTWLDLHLNKYSIEAVKQLVDSPLDLDTKKRYARYLEFVGKIPGVPQLRMDESWLREVSVFLDIDYDRCIKWLDDLSRSPKFHSKESFVEAIPKLLEEKIDIVNTMYLKDKLRFTKDLDYVKPLKRIINMDASLEEKTAFLEEVRGNESLLEFLEPEDLDAKSWIKKAKMAAGTYFQEKHINLIYPIDFMIELLKVTPNARKDLIRLMRLEQRGENIKKQFSPGKVYGFERVYGLNEHIHPVEATKLLAYGLIARREDRLNQALRYFLPEKMFKARGYVAASNFPARKLYHRYKSILETIERDMPIEEKNGICENLIKGIEEIYLLSDSHSEGKTELRELVWLVKSLFESEELFDSITAKMQDGTLYDLGDGQRLLCCAMMSRDRERSEIESLYYALDPYIGLMHIVPSWNGVYGEPIGAAIMANTRMKNKDVLLVDSMEGGILLQRVDERVSFRLAAEGILGSAIDSGSEYIMFNTNAPNGTAKRFSSYIGRMVGEEQANVELAKKVGQQYTKRPQRLLEAFKDRKVLAGEVEGYLVKTDKLAELLQH